MSDQKILTTTATDPQVAADDMEEKIKNWGKDGYKPRGGVSVTTTTIDGQTKVVFTQAVQKDD